MEVAGTPIRLAVPLSFILIASCGGSGQGSVSCGLAAMNGPLVAMEGFARGRALAAAPRSLPDTVMGRYVAGPVGKVVLSSGEDGLVHAVFGTAPPERSTPGYGALVVDERAEPMGILIYDGATIPGATAIGTIVVGDSTRPLYGVRVTRLAVESAECALFPLPPTDRPE